jgi:hypothetical protein
MFVGLRINLKTINSVHEQGRYGYNLSILLYITSAILLYGWIGNKQQGRISYEKKNSHR